MADAMEVTGGTETNLSTWAGPYVTQMLGQTQALGPATYDASGKLVGGRQVGRSDLDRLRAQRSS